MSRKAPKGEYIETDTGNKVSRKSQIIGTTNIILGGKTVIQAEVIIRGDLFRTQFSSTSTGDKGDKAGGSNIAVVIGRYCFLSKGCVLRPPGKIYKGTFSHYPLKLQDHVFIGPNCIVEAALIGNHVHIGADSVIGKFAIIKDYVKILPATIVPPNMVIPSLSIVGGRPGRVVGELAEGDVEGQSGTFVLRELYASIGN